MGGDMTVATEAQAEAFAGRMVDILNNSMLGLMISIGHRTGLFDTLADAPPLTSQELATRTGSTSVMSGNGSAPWRPAAS